MSNNNAFNMCRPAVLKNLRVPLAVVFGLLLSACGGGGGGGGAAPAPLTSVALAKTGQTLCYDVVTNIAADCTDTGQDGELQVGVTEPASRFVVGTGVGTTDQCVTDSLTGLMWVRSPSTTPDTWANALASANALNLCGFTDWRLPNVIELESMVNIGFDGLSSSQLNTLGFSNLQASFYWTSTSNASIPNEAWIVGMNYGVAASNNKIVNLYVWPVRAGQ